MSGLTQAVTALQSRGAGSPRLALLTGSGFAPMLDNWPVRQRIPYDAIPAMPPCSVPGHDGELVVVEVDADITAWVFSGRFHAYEGLAAAEVVRPVDLAHAAGAGLMVVTCAAGGIRPGLANGDMVLIRDHLNLMGFLPPPGPQPFLDLSQVYDPAASRHLREAAAAQGIDLQEGVLAALRGPVFETPAEVRMLGILGADMVSMSTVPEAIRARALGLSLAGLACIANPAAGLAAAPLDHDEVLQVVGRAAAAAGSWLLDALRRWAREGSA